MAKTARAVQVPGEPTQDLPPTEDTTQELPPAADGDESRPVLDADAVADQVDVLHAQQSAEVNSEVAALRAQLEAERLARIEAEQRAAVAAESAAAKRPAPAVVVKASAGHPTPQLTEGGWVVPQSFGAPVAKG